MRIIAVYNMHSCVAHACTVYAVTFVHVSYMHVYANQHSSCQQYFEVK